jgi:hypothetical protein
MPPDVPTLLKSGPGRSCQYGLYMEPPTDDRPFFFQTLPVLRLVRHRVRAPDRRQRDVGVARCSCWCWCSAV